jgi:hypothetical protein
MTTYKIKDIEFLTQMPENDFKGDPSVNAQLKREWVGETIVCDYEPEGHLDEVLNYIEDNCGMLVGHVQLECVGKRHPKTPNSFTEKMPSLSGMYPAGWVWVRMATLAN